MKTNKMIMIGLAGLLVALTPQQAMAYGDTPSGPDRACHNSVPAKAWLYSAKSIKSGEVELKWDKVNDASSWTVAYGVQPGKYIYGVSNFGDSNSRSIDIKSLPSGKYYFVVKANNGCMPGAFSNEWPVVVKGRGSLVASYAPAPQADNTPVVVAPKATTKTVEPKVVKTQDAKVTSAPAKVTAAPKAAVREGGDFHKTGKITNMADQSFGLHLFFEVNSNVSTYSFQGIGGLPNYRN